MKNVRIFNNVKYKTRLCALSLTGIILISALGGCKKNDNNTDVVISGNISSSEFNPDDFRISQDEIQRIEEEYGTNGTRKIFDVGEHSCNSVIIDVANIPYRDGYECVNVTKSDNIYYAIYVNVIPVECLAHSKDENGNFVYETFGTPIELEDVKIKTKLLN